MGAIQMGHVLVHGNFAEVLDEKPKDFDYMSDAKWLEPYPEKWERIQIGKTECTCEKIEVHYAPYYGFDAYHTESCAIIQRVRKRPQLLNLPAFYNYEYIGGSE